MIWNRVMKMRVLFLVFSILNFSVCANAEFWGHEALITRIAIGPSGGWRMLDSNLLPPEFQKAHPLVQNRLFVLGYQVEGKNGPGVILEVERPYLARSGTFCRSRISAYFFFEYLAGIPYKDQASSSLVDIGEYISFDQREVIGGCEVEDYKDLRGYSFVESLYSDQVLEGLFRAASVVLLEGDVLVSLGVSRIGDSGEDSSFFFAIMRRSGKLEIQLLSSSSAVSFRPHSSRQVDY